MRLRGNALRRPRGMTVDDHCFAAVACTRSQLPPDPRKPHVVSRSAVVCRAGESPCGFLPAIPGLARGGGRQVLKAHLRPSFFRGSPRSGFAPSGSERRNRSLRTALERRRPHMRDTTPTFPMGTVDLSSGPTLTYMEQGGSSGVPVALLHG